MSTYKESSSLLTIALPHTEEENCLFFKPQNRDEKIINSWSQTLELYGQTTNFGGGKDTGQHSSRNPKIRPGGINPGDRQGRDIISHVSGSDCHPSKKKKPGQP